MFRITRNTIIEKHFCKNLKPEYKNYFPADSTFRALILTYKNYFIMKGLVLLLLTLCLFTMLGAQIEINPIATGLRGPIGIELDNGGNLWVAESGSGANDGGVTIIWADGTVERAIDSLGSLFDKATQETAGPVRVQFLGTDFVGVFTPLSSRSTGPCITVFERSAFAQGNPPLRESDAVHVIRVGEFNLGNGALESNPYSLVTKDCGMYIADAAANNIVWRDGLSGAMRVVAEIPSFENPLPFGPPFVDAVPTRLIENPDGDGYLLSQLTGFPFLPGASSIYHLAEDGTVSTWQEGFSLITDLSPAPEGEGLYALQFAQFNGDSIPPFYFNSAQIIHARSGGEKDTLVSGFGPSPGLAVAADGTCYVTHLFFGMVLKIEGIMTGVQDPTGGEDKNAFSIYPNPSTAHMNLQFTAENDRNYIVKVYDLQGKLVFSEKLGELPVGKYTHQINSGNLQQTGASGIWLVTLEDGKSLVSSVVLHE